MSDERVVDMVIYGIPDETIARTIRSAKHADPEELYAAMRAMGDMPGREEKKTKQQQADRPRRRRRKAFLRKRGQLPALIAERWATWQGLPKT